jgi:adenylate kinase family enzyme
MAVVAVVGLPGSGKSTLFEEYKKQGYEDVDDIQKDNGWDRNTRKIRELHAQGKNVITSDIEFCNKELRDRLERTLGIPVEWIFFENSPYICALNCCYRYFVQGRKRREPWKEIEKLPRLSAVYNPRAGARQVQLADKSLCK